MVILLLSGSLVAVVIGVAEMIITRSFLAGFSDADEVSHFSTDTLSSRYLKAHLGVTYFRFLPIITSANQWFSCSRCANKRQPALT